MALSERIKSALNRKDLIAARDNWFDRLEDVFHGKDNNCVFSVCGMLMKGKSDAFREPEKWTEECLEELAENYSEKILDKNIFVPLCVEYGIYGVHYIDKIFGAEVYYENGQWYNRYIDTEIGTLKYPDLSKNETFNLSIRAAKFFADSGALLPLFGLPTIASALNIAVNLYGQEILMEMLYNPENALKDLKTINHLLMYIHRAFRNILPYRQLQPVISWVRTQPPGYGQLCGCTTQLISSSLYSDYVAELDNELLGVYENGGMIHLCGSHLQHLESFRKMKNLKAIQINDRAAWDLKDYYEGLREDQIIYLDPCSGMTVEKALKITGGHRLVIMERIDPPIPVKKL